MTSTVWSIGRHGKRKIDGKPNIRVFSRAQRKLARVAFARMPKHLQLVIWDRIVDAHSIQDVAEKYRLSWDQADHLIQEGLKILRKTYWKLERRISHANR